LEEQFTLTVYNPLTGQSKTVVVTEAVYNEYRRGIWRMKDNDRRFRKNVSVFSNLNGDYDCFCEFCSDDNNPACVVERNLLQQDLSRVCELLPEDDRILLCAIFVDGKTEREIATLFGISQNAISQRKRRLINFLKKILL